MPHRIVYHMEDLLGASWQRVGAPEPDLAGSLTDNPTARGIGQLPTWWTWQQQQPPGPTATVQHQTQETMRRKMTHDCETPRQQEWHFSPRPAAANTTVCTI